MLNRLVSYLIYSIIGEDVKIDYIDGIKFYHAFSNGNQEVLKSKLHLNKINVFPVADGDTGTNLAFTLNSIVEGSSEDSSISVVSREMANAAILGSRGNSGIIFAQFMQGISEGIQNKSILYPKDFVAAIKAGVTKAYTSMNNPVEGTILSVMKTWSDSLHSLHDKGHDFVELISRSIKEARKELKETPNKLKVLKDAGVVDAGGQGFVNFIEGFLQFVKSGIKHKNVKIESIDINQSNGHSFKKYHKPEFRYCTESVVKNLSIDIEELRSAISVYGDSYIAAGSNDYFKFHIHTNTPQALFYQLKNYGSIVQSKVDDMQRQIDMQFNRKSDIAIVVDSACDLPEDFIDDHQINIIPINMVFGEHQFLDKITLTPEHFYEMLGKEEVVPQTSQPSIKSFENLYESLFEHYDSIISIHLSSKLSGTFNAAKIASKKFDNKKIAVVDSKHLSTSFGLIVQRVTEEIEKGKSLKDVVDFTNQLTSKVKLLVAVPSLKYMVRSGRVSPLKGFIASLLNLNPIVSLDEKGASKLYGKSFSYEANIKKIIGILRKQNETNPVIKFAVGHSNNKIKALEVVSRIEKIVGLKAAFIYDIAPVIGLHAGAGAVSISFIIEE